MLTGRRRPGVRGAGAPVKRRSDGYEFAELRQYVSGDDPRRIDWAATARAGALQTRVVFEDHALTLATALDASASMFVGRKKSNYDLATEAAAFWYGAAIDDDRCARVTRDGLVFARDLRGRVAARLCLEATASESHVTFSEASESHVTLSEGAKRRSRSANGASPLSELNVAPSEVEGPPRTFAGMLEIALAALPREAHLLIVSDFFELTEPPSLPAGQPKTRAAVALEPLVRACAARFDLTALIVSDPWRSGLPLGGFVRLRDAETGRQGRYFIGPHERARYRDAVSLRERLTLGALLRMGIRAAFLDADHRVEDALFEAFGIG